MFLMIPIIDKNQESDTVRQAVNKLQVIGETPLHGRFKVWIFHLYSAPTRGRSLAVQAGLRTRHIMTVAITTACRNATHSAKLHAKSSLKEKSSNS